MLICSGPMASACFTGHQPRELLPMQNYGAAALYSWFFLLIAALGPAAPTGQA